MEQHYEVDSVNVKDHDGRATAPKLKDYLSQTADRREAEGLVWSTHIHHIHQAMHDAVDNRQFYIYIASTVTVHIETVDPHYVIKAPLSTLSNVSTQVEKWLASEGFAEIEKHIGVKFPVHVIRLKVTW